MEKDANTHFLRQLTLFEDDLLDPIVDQSSLTAFTCRWTTLVSDLTSAIDANTLSASTISVAHILAGKVSAVIQNFLDLDIISEKLTSSFDVEAASILAAYDTPQSTSHTPEKASYPSYIEPSYRWLLLNIHNPYPSVRVRDRIAEESKCARKDIDSWFIDARRRIGWNALRKSTFSNKQVDIVDAATRFFVHGDSTRPIEPNIELEFVTVEQRAKGLYHVKFSPSGLATKLDEAVKNLTPETKIEAEEYRLRQLQAQATISPSPEVFSYPSPERSPHHSPELAVVADAGGPDTCVSPSISTYSRKRRSLSIDLPDLTPADRPSKRSRLAPRLSGAGVIFSAGLPSPASSTEECLEPHSNPDSNVPVISGRKRRLSDAHDHGAPKRPCSIPLGPRLQAVYDPLPLSNTLFDESTFDGWFKHIFETAHVDAIDSSTLFDVELGNISDSEGATQSLPSSTVQTGGQTVITPVFSSEPEPFELALDLVESWPSGHQVSSTSTQEDILQMSDFLYHILPPVIESLHDLNDFTFGSSQPSAPFKDPVPSSWKSLDYFDDQTPNSVPCIDPLQDLLNFGSEDTLPSSHFVSGAEYSVPAIDLVSPPLIQSDRAEKERRLLKYKEAARKLEEELAVSQ